MLFCPYCQVPLTPPVSECPRCRADVSPLFESARQLGSPILVVRGPAGSVARFRLRDGTHHLGCADPDEGHHPDIDLTAVDSDQVVSRRHVIVRVRSGRVYLAEEPTTGDANTDRTRYAAGQRGRAGTLVNGTPVRTGEVEVSPSDDIRFGSVLARLERE